MNAGKVWSYMHNDRITKNKSLTTVKVVCQTNFCANTKEFEDFAADAARFAYASHLTSHNEKPVWDEVVEAFPDMEVRRLHLSKHFGENIEVTEIRVMKI
jgi:translation elongation factor EF-Ts